MAADLQTEDGHDANLIRHPNAFGHAHLGGSPQVGGMGAYPLAAEGSGTASGYSTPRVGGSGGMSVIGGGSVGSPSSSLHESDSPREEEGSGRGSEGEEEEGKRASGVVRGIKEETTDDVINLPSTSSRFPSVFGDSAPTSPDLNLAVKRRRLSSSAAQPRPQLQPHIQPSPWHSTPYPTPSALRSHLLAPPPHTTSAYLPHASELDHTEPPGTTVPNLIGALHTNAFKLKDDKGAKGIFFVFHDLSVRTEGRFRLRLRFLSIGAGGRRLEAGGMGIKAETYSEVFGVSSAKKFEGMMDPTPLSQCMARQGVRIPTRKVARTKSGGVAATGAGTKRKARGAPNGEEDELEED